MRNIIRTQTYFNVQSDARLDLTITPMRRHDGGELLVLDQPSLPSRQDGDSDRVALDDAAQLALYIHLAKKFGGA